jgi:hypothetical protein
MLSLWRYTSTKIFNPEGEGSFLPRPSYPWYGTNKALGRPHSRCGRCREEKHILLLPGIKLPVPGISHFYCIRLYPDHKQPAMNTAGNKPSRRKLYTTSATSVSTHTGSISTYHRHWNSHLHKFLNCGAVNPSPTSQHSTHRISPIRHEERLFCRIFN